MGQALTTRANRLFSIGLIMALIAYFLPWYAHPAAGLTLIGIDISEWLKFLPQYGSGQLPNRDYFYLPPIAIGLSLMLWSVQHAQNRIKTIIGFGIGGLITLFAFPSIDAIRFEPASEWQQRLVWIAGTLLIGLITLGINLFLDKEDLKTWGNWAHPVLILLSMLSTLYYVVLAIRAFRPVYIDWLKVTPAYGMGVWLFVLGSLLIIGSQVVYLYSLRISPQTV